MSIAKRLVPVAVGAGGGGGRGGRGPVSSDADRRPPAALLRGVDRAAFAVSLAVRLRQRGVPVGLTGDRGLRPRARRSRPPDSLPSLYWTARIAWCGAGPSSRRSTRSSTRCSGDATFEVDPVARRGAGPAPGASDDARAGAEAGRRRPAPGDGLPWATLPPAVATAADDDDGGLELPTRWASDLAAVADRAVRAARREAELAVLGRWLDDGAPALADPPDAARRAPTPGGRPGRAAADARHGPAYRLGAGRPGAGRAGAAAAPGGDAVRRQPVDAAAGCRRTCT